MGMLFGIEGVEIRHGDCGRVAAVGVGERRYGFCRHSRLERHTVLRLRIDFSDRERVKGAHAHAQGRTKPGGRVKG